MDYKCEECDKSLSEGDPMKKYEDVIVCEECYKLTLHDIGRTM